jgi:hypothetical protein
VLNVSCNADDNVVSSVICVSEVSNLFGCDICDVFSDSQNWLAQEMVSEARVMQVLNRALELIFIAGEGGSVNIVSFGFDL